jgi:hypothetical protein
MPIGQLPQQQQSGSSEPKKTGKSVRDDKGDQHPDDKESMRLAVKQWQKKVKAAEERQRVPFGEMRQSMKFAAGYQWPGQKKLADPRYKANWTLRMVNAKVASLYAKNPTASYERRKRLDFALYDGKLENLIPVLQKASMNPMGLMGLQVQEKALIGDYMHGMQTREMIDKVGKTLEVLFQYQLDEQDEEEGDFKLQMKQLTRRVIIAKVGYVRVSFVRDKDALVTSSGLGNTTTTRALQIQHITDKVEEGELTRTSTQVEDLTRLAQGLGGLMNDKKGAFGENERIVYDCLPSTSVLVDPNCKALKGFIGAKWIAIKYVLTVNDANAVFEAKIKSGSKDEGTGSKSNKASMDPRAGVPEKGEETVNVYEILDKNTRTHFFIADGHPDYLAEPEYLEPNVRGFWPVGAVTFNDVEADVCGGQTPFPPSDVELVMDAQKETNRSREELKKHRKANAPSWLATRGLLSEDDKDAINNGDSHDLIELQNVPQGMKNSDVFTPKPQVPINPVVYDTSPQMQDAQLTTGNPQESLGGANGKTATGDQINEQNRMTVTSSNIDDMDDLLTWIARVSGEMMIQGFSMQTVQRIAGPGGVMPQMPEDRQMFLAAVVLTTKAASSGRPNKALDIRNWQMVAPILQQAGANPQFMVRKTLDIVDSNINVEEAFPLMPTAAQPPGQVSPSGGEHQPSQQQSHQPGVTPPPQQGRQHPQHQPPAHPGSVQNQPGQMVHN